MRIRIFHDVRDYRKPKGDPSKIEGIALFISFVKRGGIEEDRNFTEAHIDSASYGVI